MNAGGPRWSCCTWLLHDGVLSPNAAKGSVANRREWRHLARHGSSIGSWGWACGASAPWPPPPAEARPAVAESLLAEDWRVCVTSSSEPSIEAAAREMAKAGGEVHALDADLGRYDECDRRASVAQQLGRGLASDGVDLQALPCHEGLQRDRTLTMDQSSVGRSALLAAVSAPGRWLRERRAPPCPAIYLLFLDEAKLLED